MDCSPPGSSVHGIFQAKVLVWIAISFSRDSSRPRDRTQVSRIAGDALPSEPPLLIEKFHQKGEIRWEMCVGHLTHSKNRVQAASTA